MKQFSKHIALFLTLVVLSNGLFAAQMAVTMIKDSPKFESVQEKSPCHDKASEMSDEKIMECCQGDCTGCVLSPSLTDAVKVDLPNSPQMTEQILINNHLLPAHNSNLYRPPILV